MDISTNLKQRIFLFILLLSFFYPFSRASAQGRWLPGYILNNAGDTLTGFVSFRHSHRSPLSVSFRRKPGDKVVTFLPNEIRMFSEHFEGQDLFYKSFHTQIDGSPVALDKLDNDPAPTMVDQTFFAQLIMKGKKSFYCYFDPANNKPHYLIEEENGTVIDLINNRYYVGNQRVNSVYSETYKKQLGKLLSDCSQLSISRINAAAFTQKNIGSLLNDYYKCDQQNASPLYRVKKEQNLNQFGVIGGVGLFKMYMNIATSPSGSLLRFNNAVDFSAGIYLNFVLPHTQKAWSIYNKLLLAHYDMHAPEFTNALSYTTTYTNIDIRQTALKLIDMIRYQYPGFRNLKPFFEFGIGNAYALQLSATANYYYTANGPSSAESGQLFAYRKYEQSFCAGLGTTYKRFGAGLQFSYTSGISSDIVSHAKPIDLLLSYQLNKH